MANISDAHGDIIIDPDFYAAHKTIIDNFFNDAIKRENLMADYGIIINAKEPDSTMLFYGSGRWSFANTIDQALVPWSFITGKQTDAQNDLFEDFYNALCKSDTPVITLDYTDYEAGSEYIVHEVAQVSAIKNRTDTQIDNDQWFTHEITEQESIDYTDRNKIENEFEDGYLLDDPDAKQEMLNAYIKPWYDDQPDDFKNNHPYDEFTDALTQAITDNDEYDNAICTWRLDDDLDDVIDELDID